MLEGSANYVFDTNQSANVLDALWPSKFMEAPIDLLGYDSNVMI